VASKHPLRGGATLQDKDAATVHEER
jgi:hypothetical protein